MDNMINQYLNDCDIISADPSRLDKYYGKSLNLPRPEIIEDGNSRYLTDKEYAVYLYLNTCQLLTELDLLTCVGHCMGDDTLDTNYGGVTITRELNHIWFAVDHLHYVSPSTDGSNIGKYEVGDMDYIVNHDNTDDVYRVPGESSFTGTYVTYVNVPYGDWSGAFLLFLVDFISIKGNVLVREVIL